MTGLVGRRIKFVRTTQQMTQRELAQRARLNHKYVNALEVGKMNCSLVTLLRIADALQCPMTALIPRQQWPGTFVDDADDQAEGESEPLAA